MSAFLLLIVILLYYFFQYDRHVLYTQFVSVVTKYVKSTRFSTNIVATVQFNFTKYGITTLLWVVLDWYVSLTDINTPFMYVKFSVKDHSTDYKF